jgi:hypothetical protein
MEADDSCSYAPDGAGAGPIVNCFGPRSQLSSQAKTDGSFRDIIGPSVERGR